MTPRGISRADTRGCRKPNCTHESASLNRHHRGFESLWFTSWHHFRGRKWWYKIVERYKQFLPQDIVVLCTWHHAEIHWHYDKIIARHCARNDRPLYKFTREQGDRLQAALRAFCAVWLLEESPGIDPRRYSRIKRAYRRKLRKEAKNGPRTD